MNRTEAIKTMNFFRNRFLEVSDRARGDAKLQDSCQEGIEAALEKRKELSAFHLKDICRKPQLNEADAKFLISEIGQDILSINEMGYDVSIDFNGISRVEYGFAEIFNNFLVDKKMIGNRISVFYRNRNTDIKEAFLSL